MTREEAVARIKDHIEIHRYHERNAVKIFEALDMAIKALEQPEPCEDAVSRQAVYTVIEEVLYETTKGADNWYGLLNDGVRTLPPAQPEPCEDAISRAEAQTALQFVARRYTVSHEAHGEGYVVWSDNLISVPDAMNALREVLSVTPKEQRWIPCSERLPEDEENEYLVTILDRDDDVCEVYKGFHQNGKWWTQWCHGCLELEKEPCGDNIVIAWRPLPEPYREEGEKR